MPSKQTFFLCLYRADPPMRPAVQPHLENSMNRLFVFAAATLAFALSACGTSPQQACKDITATTCNKLYTCYTGAELDGIKTAYGATEADCVTKLQASAKCDATDVCDTGKTYDGSAASTCLSEFKALSCDALKAGNTPSSCNNVCK